MRRLTSIDVLALDGGGPPMFQRLKLLKDVLWLYLSQRQAKALLESVQASNLSDEDRDRISHILRVMLRLPDDPVQEPSGPDAP